MISSYCIMSLVWSRIFLKEKLSKAQYAVIAVAAVGIAILGVVILKANSIAIESCIIPDNATLFFEL